MAGNFIFKFTNIFNETVLQSSDKQIVILHQ